MADDDALPTDAAVTADQDERSEEPITVLQRLRQLRGQKAALLAAVTFLTMLVGGALAPFLTPYGPAEIVSIPLEGPSGAHWFGTDEIGRDLLTRMLYGARTSISIGLLAAIVAMVIGVPWGLVSGFYGRWVDTVSMRLTDALLAFPSIILAMATVAVLGPSAFNVVIAVGIVQIPRFTRLIRAETLVFKEREFVAAAQAAGATDFYIMRRGIFPNLTATLIVQFTLAFALAVLTEAGLSFIGLGVRPPAPTWGGMLNTAKNFTNFRLSYMVMTGIAVFLLVLSLSMLGDTLRDVLDPDRVNKKTATADPAAQ
jgi:peptide/nickel transport system permease protein